MTTHDDAQAILRPGRPRPTVAAIVARYRRRTGFVVRRTVGDVVGEAITALSGDDVALDGTEQALVALARGGSITKRRMVHLLARHLRERAQRRGADKG